MILPVILLSCAFVHAQEQEEKLLDRILKPNTTLGNDAQNKTFNGGKSFQKTGSAHVKDFYFPQRFTTKDFSTKPFYDSKPYQQSDSKFATSEANTKGRFTIPNADKKVETKSVNVKDARESGKNYATNTYETREFRGRGKSQDKMDLESANRKPLTIDQVRELLNKNK